MKKQILAAWAAGCAVGAATMVLLMGSGCVAGFFAIANANASGSEGSIVSATCNVQGTSMGKPATFAVLSLPGRAKEDLAVNVVRVQTSPTSSANATIPGGSFYQASDIVVGGMLVSDGAVAVECFSGPGDAVPFFVR